MTEGVSLFSMGMQKVVGVSAKGVNIHKALGVCPEDDDSKEVPDIDMKDGIRQDVSKMEDKDDEGLGRWDIVENMLR